MRRVLRLKSRVPKALSSACTCLLIIAFDSRRLSAAAVKPVWSATATKACMAASLSTISGLLFLKEKQYFYPIVIVQGLSEAYSLYRNAATPHELKTERPTAHDLATLT
jgi:hypothetical protein